MASGEKLGAKTNLAKYYFNQMLAGGSSFKLSKFVVTPNGHDPDNPNLALTPDVFIEGTTPESVGALTEFLDLEDVDTDDNGCVNFTAVIPAGEATGAFSQIIVFAEFVYRPSSGYPAVGTVFPYGVLNLGYRTKASTDVHTEQGGFY